VSRYDPMFLDLSVDTITVVVRSGGRSYTEVEALGAAWDFADGPQSLESGAMTAVRTICRRICLQAEDEVNGLGLGPK
jgi:hypothetical protein